MNYTQTELFTDGVFREPSTALPLRATRPDARHRPRSLLLRRGREAMRDEDLLAIMLRNGTRGCNVEELAGLILRHYGTLGELAKAIPEELVAMRMPGLGEAKATEISAMLEIARRIAEEKQEVGKPLTEPKHVADLIRPRLLDAHQEYFFILPLDRKFRLIGHRPVTVSQGLADSTLAHPREVFRQCVRVSAINVIVAHNHPSGDPTPSAEDIRLTRQLLDAGKVMGISLLDHIVVGKSEINPYLSFREREIISFSTAN